MVHGEAGAAPERADPIAGAGAAGGCARAEITVAADLAASDILPVDVGLAADDKLADLVIAAERNAGHRTADVEVAGRTDRRIPTALAEGVAGIDTDIEAGPAESRCSRHIGDRSARRRRDGRRKIGSECRGCGSKRQCASDQYSLHACLLFGHARWRRSVVRFAS